MKKQLLAISCVVLMSSTVFASSSVDELRAELAGTSTTQVQYAVSGNFLDVNPGTYSSFWQTGAYHKNTGNIEAPENYCYRLIKGHDRNYVGLMTPSMMVKYIAYSANSRLLSVPFDFSQSIINSNDMAYIVTWVPMGSSLLGGDIAVQVPTQRLVIVKNNEIIRPVLMQQSFRDLMPKSYAPMFYAFHKNIILNTPYTIKFVDGFGNIKSYEITKDTIEKAITDENNFYQVH